MAVDARGRYGTLAMDAKPPEYVPAGTRERPMSAVTDWLYNVATMAVGLLIVLGVVYLLGWKIVAVRRTRGKATDE